MRQFKKILLIAAVLLVDVAICSAQSEYSLINFKAVKARKQTNQKVLTNSIANYYLQPYRLSAKKPEVAVAEIGKLYQKKAKKPLPKATQIELAAAIKNYQSREGKQSGFENSRNLASVLPTKSVSNRSFDEEPSP